MVKFDSKEEVFLDTVDYLSSEESVVEKEDIGFTELGYGVWMCEPPSVNERRERFIKDMGLLELNTSPELGLNKLRDRSGAVSDSCTLSFNSVEECIVCAERDFSREGSCIVDKLDQDQMNLNNLPERENVEVLISTKHIEHGPAEAYSCETEDIFVDQKKARSLWKSFKRKFKVTIGTDMKSVSGKSKSSRLKVQKNNKKWQEMSAVYVGQEFRAHKGLIWTMKFSPDGQYLASGGEDGVVRIWCVTTACTSCKNMYIACDGQQRNRKPNYTMKLKHTSVVVPDTDIHIEELPLQELYGHTSDVLDLAWSNSNCLLSSSKDKTVRLWKVGHDECLGVFCHNNYVTCTQFNPVYDNYFISGSIDGKVRMWGVAEKRVVYWADGRDVITAISYHPNGKCFAVGSLSGTCRIYDSSGNDLVLTAEFHVRGKKKRGGNRITGIEFLEEDSKKLMITSEDSKIRIFDGIDVICKYRGLSKSGSQMSASFTSTNTHIISVGEDSRIYVWNYDDMSVPSKRAKTIHSCEHFFTRGVSVAIPRCSKKLNQKGCAYTPWCYVEKQDHQDSTLCIQESEGFSLANWLFIDGSYKHAATWPEDKLPVWNEAPPEQNYLSNHHDIRGYLPATWGLVIVTAGFDGMIRTFHNYGLPVRK